MFGLKRKAFPEDHEIVALKQRIEALERDLRIQKHFAFISLLHYATGDQSHETVIDHAAVEADSDPSWIHQMITHPKMHEPEFSIFRFFIDSSETILDVGANYGYSAASIWAGGSCASVMSFEANPAHKDCLEIIKKEKSGLFDYEICGLGSRKGEMEYTAPVVSGKAISGLASFTMKTQIPFLATKNLPDHVQNYCSPDKMPELRFSTLKLPVMKLDDFFSDRPVKIAAIKIDVEGSEPDVLEGAQLTLMKHKPLIMIEGGNRNIRVGELMSRLQYSYADFDEGFLIPTEAISVNCNGFFFHKDRLTEYRGRGIIR